MDAFSVLIKMEAEVKVTGEGHANRKHSAKQTCKSKDRQKNQRQPGITYTEEKS